MIKWPKFTIWEQDYYGLSGFIFWFQCWLENCVMFFVVALLLYGFQKKMDADYRWNQHPGMSKRDWIKLNGG